MPMIRCHDCGRLMSDSARFCAGCGLTEKKDKKKRSRSLEIVLLTAFGLVSSLLIVLGGKI